MRLDFRFLWERPLLAGGLGGALLLFVFFALMLFRNPWSIAVFEFWRLFPWIALLVLGFGAQVYLYAFLKKSLARKAVLAGAKKEVAAAGGISAAAMAACCAHHFTDVLPFLGLAFAASFLAQYQELFLLIGVLSNALGIIMMLGVFKKMKLGGNCPVVKSFTAEQFDFAFKAGSVASAAIVLAYALVFLR